MNRAVLVGLIVAIVIAVGAGGWIYCTGQGIGATLPNAELDASEPAPAVPEVKEGEKVLGEARRAGHHRRVFLARLHPLQALPR